MGNVTSSERASSEHRPKRRAGHKIKIMRLVRGMGEMGTHVAVIRPIFPVPFLPIHLIRAFGNKLLVENGNIEYWKPSTDGVMPQESVFVLIQQESLEISLVGGQAQVVPFQVSPE
jgi:hypothetical protein